MCHSKKDRRSQALQTLNFSPLAACDPQLEVEWRKRHGCPFHHHPLPCRAPWDTSWAYQLISALHAQCKDRDDHSLLFIYFT